MFAGVFVENFLVQAAVRGEPALRGRALALVEGVPPLTKVAAVSEVARRAGVEIGMPKSTAAQFSGVEIRARSLALEKNAHAALLDLGWSISPRIEATAADTMVADVAGLGNLLGSEEEIAKEITERGRSCGLTLNVAVAANIGTAVVAARGFAGACVIAAGTEAARLSELPVSVLTLSRETAETLERWGVRTCGALAALPVLELSERLGQEGVRLCALARGEGTRAMDVAKPGHTFEEELELDDGVEELEPLSFLLGRLLDALCARLTARALAASVIRMRFELEPAFETAIDTKKEIVRAKNLPNVFERELQLPVPMRDAKMLLKLVRLRLQTNPPAAPIVKIRMTAEAARTRVTQSGLFLPSFPDAERLELTIARIANVVGQANVGVAERMDTHRPDAFHMKPFAVPAEKEENDCVLAAADSNGRTPMSCRLFRPALPAMVDLQEGRPVRLFFAGMKGEVTAAAGPWKMSGDWWREDAWQQEEWDLELVFRVGPQQKEHRLYRVYYDAKCCGWFVRGMYD
jgi:protein ImuB